MHYHCMYHFPAKKAPFGAFLAGKINFFKSWSESSRLSDFREKLATRGRFGQKWAFLTHFCPKWPHGKYFQENPGDLHTFSRKRAKMTIFGPFFEIVSRFLQFWKIAFSIADLMQVFGQKPSKITGGFWTPFKKMTDVGPKIMIGQILWHGLQLEKVHFWPAQLI